MYLVLETVQTNRVKPIKNEHVLWMMGDFIYFESMIPSWHLINFSFQSFWFTRPALRQDVCSLSFCAPFCVVQMAAVWTTRLGRRGDGAAWSTWPGVWQERMEQSSPSRHQIIRRWLEVLMVLQKLRARVSLVLKVTKKKVGRVIFKVVWKKLHSLLNSGDLHGYRFLLNLHRVYFDGVEDLHPIQSLVPNFVTEIDPVADADGFHHGKVSSWQPLQVHLWSRCGWLVPFMLCCFNWPSRFG